MLLNSLRNAARSKTSIFLKQMLNDINIQQTAQQQQISSSAMSAEQVTTAVSAKSTAVAAASTKEAVAANNKSAPPQLRRDKQAAAKKKASTLHTPGTVSLQILGTGANGAPAAVYLFTDQSRYLFNCGEGTQRLAHEHKTKLARLEQIFVTRNTWSVMGGLPGLLLTVQDAGVRELALHGPPYLDSILQSMKRFVVLKTLQVKTQDSTQIREFEDAVMSVQMVPLYSDQTPDKMVIAYICKLKPRPGALCLEKCVEQGVKPGPLLGLLKNGIDVTLDNGKVVRSQDVSEPGETPLRFIFLDVPGEEYLHALEAQAARFHDTKQESGFETALVVHFTPQQLVENKRYQSFVQQFGGSTQQLYLHSPKNTFSGYIATHRIQYQLNQLQPQLFPLLGESTQLCNTQAISNKLKKTKLQEEAVEDKTEQQHQPHAGINSLTNFHLRPRKGLDRTTEARLQPSEYINEAQALPGFPALLAELQTQQKSLLVPKSNADTYPKITFLGTGSCIPNKTRNVSAILVQPHANSSMLLDCGEGTLGQIVRFFGLQQARHVLRNLRAIYVSHLHADHHIGLIDLLVERQRLVAAENSAEKLLLFAPKQLLPWLQFYDERIECINDSYELIGNGEMLEQPLQLSQTHAELGIDSIATCLVRHCPHSFGVSLLLPATADQPEQPMKITYSGDSMPCRDLVELGAQSTILIHEATMEDDLVEEAKLKMHSTISQAIAQGRAMQAQHIILTHFSQRYAKLPRMQSLAAEEEAAAMHNVSIAFDNMQVTLPDLQHFQLLYPALKALFAEHAEELEQKALKRELKLERKRKMLDAN